MGGQDAVLVGGAGPAHEFQRTKVGREETQGGDPGGHFAAGEEEIFTRFRVLLQVEADTEDRKKIQNNDGEIDSGECQQMGWSGLQEESRGEGTSCNRLHLLIVGTCSVNVKPAVPAVMKPAESELSVWV